jgi:hypothetical protein
VLVALQSHGSITVVAVANNKCERGLKLDGGERENRDNYVADDRGDEERVVCTRPVAFLPRPCIAPCLLPLLVNTPKGNQKQP